MAPTIRVEPARGRHRLVVDGIALADSARALALTEGAYPTVLYIPRDDVAMDRLVAHDKRSRCPWKGEARHFSAALPGRTVAIAAWSYETPLDAVAPIAGHIAFYTDNLGASFEDA